MKEATGELNMTVVTVVAIAAIAAIFYVFVWPSIQLNLQSSTACSGGPNTSGQAGSVGWTCGNAGTNGRFTCTVSNGNRRTNKTCNNSSTGG